jgi:hypothetical protein
MFNGQVVHHWSPDHATNDPEMLCACGTVRYEDRGSVACEHGSQRRACTTCALLDAEEDVINAEIEIVKLRADLAAAEEAIRDAHDETSGAAACDDERLPYEEIQVTRGWRAEWRNLPAVRKALEGAR